MRLFFVFLPTLLRQDCQNLIVHVQTNNLTNMSFGKFIIFSSFPDSEQKFSEVWRKVFDKVVTTAFCVSRWRFFSLFEGRKREKVFFSKKLHCYLFQTLNEKDPQCLLQAWLGQACQKFVVQVQTNIFANRFFWKAYQFFVISGIPAKNLQSFDENVLTGWSQLRSTCTEAQYEEKQFSFEKFINFFVIFWNLNGKSVGILEELFWCVCRNCILRC